MDARRVQAGYCLPVSFAANRAKASIAAACEAMFPKNTIGAPDYTDSDLIARTWSYIGMLPSTQRTLITLLFMFLELFAPMLAGKLGRYSRLDLEARCEVIRRFRGSSLYLLKLMGDSVKGILTMIYMAHPSVVRHIGQYSACDHADGFAVEVRKDALVRISAR
jgi:hypothetical protein